MMQQQLQNKKLKQGKGSNQHPKLNIVPSSPFFNPLKQSVESVVSLMSNAQIGTININSQCDSCCANRHDKDHYSCCAQHHLSLKFSPFLGL